MLLKKLFFSFFFFIACKVYADDTLSVLSPNHHVQVTIYHQPDGQIKYGVYYKGRYFIKPSGLAMKLKTPAALLDKFDIIDRKQAAFNESWKPVWGEVNTIRNVYEELTLQLKDRSGSNVLINIVFRVYDEGV